MTAFALLSIDDLARLASRKLADNAMSKGIGDTLAQEFRAAGVALASPDGGSPFETMRGHYVVDPTICQGECDAALLKSLRGAAANGPAALAQCLAKAETTEQAKACFAPPDPNLVKIEAYLECCYLWCDSYWDGTDKCKY